MDTKNLTDAIAAAQAKLDACDAAADFASFAAALLELGKAKGALRATQDPKAVERAEWEALQVEQAAADELSHKRVMGNDPEWTAERAKYDAGIVALDRAMNTEPSDI